MKCDLCNSEGCCPQSDVCDGQNWAFLSKPIFICPYRLVVAGEHQVKWNTGSPWCLNCDCPAVFARPKKDNIKEE